MDKEVAQGVRLLFRVRLIAPRAAASWRPARSRDEEKAKPKEAKKEPEAPVELRTTCCVGPRSFCTEVESQHRRFKLEGTAGGELLVTDLVSKRCGVVRGPKSARRRGEPRCRVDLAPSAKVRQSPLGPAALSEGWLTFGRERVFFRGAFVKAAGLSCSHERVMACLFPEPFLGAQLKEALGKNGLPVWMELSSSATATSTASLELLEVGPWTEEARRPAEGGTCPDLPWGSRAAHGGSANLGLGPLDTLDADDLELLNDSLALLLGAPIDAGVALAPGFYRKLAGMGAALARLVLPLEDRRLRFNVDWFARFRAALIDAGWPATDLDQNLASVIEFVIAADLAGAESLDEVPDLTALLDPAQLAQLTESFAESEGIGRWFGFSNDDARKEIASRYLTEVLAAPYRADFRPPADFSEWLEGSPLEGVEASFDAGSGEIVLRHVLGIMHVHLSRLRLTMRAPDPALAFEALAAEGPTLGLGIEFFQLTFDFWTEPSAEWWMIIVRVVTLGLTDAALWNAGVGDMSVGSSSLIASLSAERDGDRLRTRWRQGAASQVDTNVFAIGWNPLQDLILLTGAGLVSLFDGLRGTVLAQIQSNVNDAIEEQRLLEFPRFFTCGSAIPSGEDGSDRATRVLARPTSVEPLITQGASIYYRGIYDFAGAGTRDRRPFDPRMPLDGAYVFHRKVLARLVEARSRLAGDRPSLTVPNPSSGSNLDVLPALVRDAQALDSDFIDALVAAGLLSPQHGANWKHILMMEQGFLAISGHSGGVIGIEEVVPVPTLRLEVKADVTFGDGLDGVAITSGKSDPIAVVRLSITGFHGMGFDFVTDLGTMARATIKNLWDDLNPSLTPSFRRDLPPTFGETPVMEVVVVRQMLLEVGLANQETEPLAGFPAAFDFSLASLSVLADGPTTWRVESDDFRQPEREAAVRSRVAAQGETRLFPLERALRQRARYLDYTHILGDSVPAGLAWHVTKPDQDGTRSILAVRTIGERLYLDFELDPLVLRDLDFLDLI